MLEIGFLKLSSPVILAPMSGITDLPFRTLNRRFGCELAFVEMVNIRSLSCRNKRTLRMLATNEFDKPLGVQIIGQDPEYILKAMEILADFKYDILDFNAACPAKKLIARGVGASLLKEPAKLAEILKLIVVNAKVSVTLKIRIGWDKSSINAREIACRAQDAGISGLFIHGRTRAQGYSGNVDYQVIKEVKAALKIPVIASGDLWSAQFIKKMFDETGCDGVAVARGAIGNPWIFKETAQFLKGGTIIKKPSRQEITDTMLGHLNLCTDFYGERIGVILFRKFIDWYTKGLHKTKRLREKSRFCNTKNEMMAIIEILDNINE